MCVFCENYIMVILYFKNFYSKVTQKLLKSTHKCEEMI